MRFDEGRCGGVGLEGVSALITYEAPRRMIDGDWVEALYLDAGASEEQRAAVERILTGELGGPWKVLARFVGRREPTRVVPIEIADADDRKSVVIDGVLESALEPIRGRDRSEPVRLENMFNQIHAPSQVVASGRTVTAKGPMQVDEEPSHGLWSRFDWSESGA